MNTDEELKEAIVDCAIAWARHMTYSSTANSELRARARLAEAASALLEHRS